MARHVDGPATTGLPGAGDRGAYGGDIPPGLLRPRNAVGRTAAIFGVIALICAIGFFLIVTVPLAIVLGLLAVLLGLLGRSRVRRGLATNGGSAAIGIVTGLLSLLLIGGLAAGGVALWNHNKQDAKTFGQCVQNAGTDSQKLEACQKQFQKDITQ